MGKGSTPRPCDKKKFNSNFDRIFGEKDIMEIHRDKTCGLKISWPEVEGHRQAFTTRESKITGKKLLVCTLCDHEFTPGINEPCEHIKKFAEQCEDILKG